MGGWASKVGVGTTGGSAGCVPRPNGPEGASGTTSGDGVSGWPVGATGAARSLTAAAAAPAGGTAGEVVVASGGRAAPAASGARSLPASVAAAADVGVEAGAGIGTGCAGTAAAKFAVGTAPSLKPTSLAKPKSTTETSWARASAAAMAARLAAASRVSAEISTASAFCRGADMEMSSKSRINNCFKMSLQASRTPTGMLA